MAKHKLSRQQRTRAKAERVVSARRRPTVTFSSEPPTEAIPSVYLDIEQSGPPVPVRCPTCGFVHLLAQHSIATRDSGGDSVVNMKMMTRCSNCGGPIETTSLLSTEQFEGATIYTTENATTSAAQIKQSILDSLAQGATVDAIADQLADLDPRYQSLADWMKSNAAWLAVIAGPVLAALITVLAPLFIHGTPSHENVTNVVNQYIEQPVTVVVNGPPPGQ